ncbi:MAG: hypothetical protein MJ252_14055, partial [archaeon]|nr:hypothetical protein [archaeon]
MEATTKEETKEVSNEKKTKLKCGLMNIKHKPIIFEKIYSYLANKPMLFLSIVESFPDLKENFKGNIGKTNISNTLSEEYNKNLRYYSLSKYLFDFINFILPDDLPLENRIKDFDLFDKKYETQRNQIHEFVMNLIKKTE